MQRSLAYVTGVVLAATCDLVMCVLMLDLHKSLASKCIPLLRLLLVKMERNLKHGGVVYLSQSVLGPLRG